MCLPSNVNGETIQSITIAIGNLLCLNFGLIFGITPAHSQLYQTIDTPLKSVTDASSTVCLTGYLFLGIGLSAVVAGWLAQKIGSKSVLLLSGLLQISAWFCIHFANDPIHIYASRCFAGTAAGAAFIVLPIYINDITESREKAASLIFTMGIWQTLGILMGLIMGFYLSYDYTNIVGCCVSFAFSLLFPFVQESPIYYLNKQNTQSMEKSLRWFRGIRSIDDRNNPEFLKEVNEFKEALNAQKSISIQPMARGYVTRLFLITLLLVLASQLSGVFVILNYTKEFSVQSNPISYFLLVGAHLLGTIFARLLGPRMPRKILLGISALGGSLSLTTLALLYMDVWQCHNSMLAPYLPVIFLSLHFLFMGSGLSPLATVISTEVLPPKSYCTIYAYTTSLSWLFLFGLIETFDISMSHIHIVYILWFFVGITFCLPGLVLLILPETYRCSRAKIQQLMGHPINADIAKSLEVTNGHISRI